MLGQPSIHRPPGVDSSVRGPVQSVKVKKNKLSNDHLQQLKHSTQRERNCGLEQGQGARAGLKLPQCWVQMLVAKCTLVEIKILVSVLVLNVISVPPTWSVSRDTQYALQRASPPLLISGKMVCHVGAPFVTLASLVSST